MPVRLKGDYDTARKKFVIVFRYDSEVDALRRVKFDKHVVLTVGQKSERLYEVELDVDAMNVEAVRLISKVLEDISKHAQEVGLNRIDNYEAASRAFSQTRDELELSLSAS